MKRKAAPRSQKGSVKLILLIAIIVLIPILVFVFSQKGQNPITNIVQKQTTNETSDGVWTEQGMAIEGRYADSDFVDLGNGTFRMYYSAEPEVQGFMGQVYSATSTDGISWTQEPGTRHTGSTFPDVLKLPDGTFRMYFQNAGVIKSTTSRDGLMWTDEQGTRVDAVNSEGLSLDNVAASTTIRLQDGTYLMVYRGSIQERYNMQVPNQSTGLLFWATSNDGLTWEKKGLAIDSRNETLEGWTDGPDLITWDDGSIRMFFMGYKGVFESTFANNKFSDPKLVYRGANVDEMVVYSPNPPGDPTLGKIADTWYMYYGFHTKGIIRAVLEK